MSTAARRWLLLLVVLAAVGGFSAVALGAESGGSSEDDAAPSPSATAAATPTAAGSPAAGSSTAAQDPRATSTEVVETEAPDDVATDERPVAADGEATLQIGYADVAAGSLEVNAFVVDRVEDGGTCTLTVSRGERSHAVTAPAFADATTTICEPLVMSTGDLAPGPWDVVVTYTTDDATGSSAPVEVTVP